MQIQTVLLILLAAILSLAIVLFQYHKNFKKRGRTAWLLSFLRFISLFGVSLLLINPKFTKTEYSLVKANLVVLADNSSSLKKEEASMKSAIDEILLNTTIAEKFNLHQFSFGSSLSSDSLSFTERQTNITSALTGISEIFDQQNTVLLLLTDGNQNIGQDYSFYRPADWLSIYPIAMGDTTKYEDLYISQVNANRFAFLNNQFPIEIMTLTRVIVRFKHN